MRTEIEPGRFAPPTSGFSTLPTRTRYVEPAVTWKLAMRAEVAEHPDGLGLLPK